MGASLSQAVRGGTEDVATAAADTDVELTYAAIALQSGAHTTGGKPLGGNLKRAHVISGISFSYAIGTPAGGRLQVIDGTDVVFDIDVESGIVNDHVYFSPPKVGGSGNLLTVKLFAAGGTSVGKVSVHAHWLQ